MHGLGGPLFKTEDFPHTTIGARTTARKGSERGLGASY